MKENKEGDFFDKKEKEEEMTLSDICGLIEKEKEKEEEIWDENSGKSLFEKLSEVNEVFLNELLEKKEQFDKVFRTEKGSFYFVLKTGESLRIKRDNEEVDQKCKRQPILEKVFFITEEEVNRIKNEHILEWQGGSIKTIDYKIGAIPLEFNIRDYYSKIVFDEEEEWLKNIRSETDSVTEKKEGESLAGTYHIGHPITEILK